MCVYEAHFYQKLGHAEHYIGFTGDEENLERRIAEHRAARFERFNQPQTLDGKKHNGNRTGNGATLLAAVNAAGIEWEVIRVWKGADRAFERKLKRQKNAWRLCRVCNPDHWDTRGNFQEHHHVNAPGDRIYDGNAADCPLCKEWRRQ